MGSDPDFVSGLRKDEHWNRSLPGLSLLASLSRHAAPTGSTPPHTCAHTLTYTERVQSIKCFEVREELGNEMSLS